MARPKRRFYSPNRNPASVTQGWRTTDTFIDAVTSPAWLAAMCSRYTYNKDEAKLKLCDQILVFGFVPRSDIRPTDLGPVIIPEHESFACRQMSWGWRVP